MEKTLCKWKDGNEPCEYCPRKISALYMCKLLQDEQRLEAGQNETIVMRTNKEIREELFQKLMNQISIYSGRMNGGLATLQDLFHKLNNGEKIVCECCGNRVDGEGGHESNCMIVEKYQEVFGE